MAYFRTNVLDNQIKAAMKDSGVIIAEKDEEGNLQQTKVIKDTDYINISDVTTLIDYLLNNESTTINMENSDVDPDGEINIADVTALIDLLLTSTQ